MKYYVIIYQSLVKTSNGLKSRAKMARHVKDIFWLYNISKSYRNLNEKKKRKKWQKILSFTLWNEWKKPAKK